MEITWEKNPFEILDNVANSVRNKAIRIAMNKAAAQVKEAVVANAPSRTGALKKSIRIIIKNYQNKNVWVAIIGPKSDFKKTTGRGQFKVVSRPALYAKLVEQGTKRAKARPFLAPAYESTKQGFCDTMIKAIADQVEKLLV